MSKKVKKIIPKEIKPALPFVAAAFGAPYLSGSSFMTSAISNPFVRNIVAKGITSAATSKLQGDDTKTALRSALFAAAPDVLAKGLGSAGRALGTMTPESKLAQTLVSKGTGLEATLAKPGLDIGTAKVIGAQTAAEAGARAVDLNEKMLRDYEAQLREQGIVDSAERRNKIFGYFSRAGYGDTEINSMLDKYGYKDGGKVKKVSLKDFAKDFEKELKNRRQGLKRGGSAGVVAELLRLRDDEGKPVYTYEEAVEKADEYFPEDFDLGSLQAGIGGLETAFGRSFMAQPKPVPMMRFADGGITSTEEAKVYMTDDNSGVQYLDSKGNPITKEEFFKGTDEAEREGKAMGGIMKKAGKELMKRIVQPAKRKIGQMTDDVEIDVNFDGDMYDDGTSYGITEINILPKTKKGKEALDQAVKEGSAEMSSDGSYFVKDVEEVSGLLYEKGIKASGVSKPGYSKGRQFERFDEGASQYDYFPGKDYSIEVFEDLARKRKADGGIMNVSDLNNERFLEQRAEQYMEEGFSPEDAMDKALDDLKNNRFPALKDGGMMNLGGREMDMRGGGFIPIGKKERADDVPARLSKNEFVMTADAVRGAGNGSINKGAKRMYDLMNKLESKI